MRCYCCNNLEATLWGKRYYCAPCKEAILNVIQEDPVTEGYSDDWPDVLSFEEYELMEGDDE